MLKYVINRLFFYDNRCFNCEVLKFSVACYLSGFVVNNLIYGIFFSFFYWSDINFKNFIRIFIPDFLINFTVFAKIITYKNYFFVGFLIIISLSFSVLCSKPLVCDFLIIIVSGLKLSFLKCLYT